MKNLKILNSIGWEICSNFFGAEKEFCLLVKDGKEVMVYNDLLPESEKPLLFPSNNKEVPQDQDILRVIPLGYYENHSSRCAICLENI